MQTYKIIINWKGYVYKSYGSLLYISVIDINLTSYTCTDYEILTKVLAKHMLAGLKLGLSSSLMKIVVQTSGCVYRVDNIKNLREVSKEILDPLKQTKSSLIFIVYEPSLSLLVGKKSNTKKTKKVSSLKLEESRFFFSFAFICAIIYIIYEKTS